MSSRTTQRSGSMDSNDKNNNNSNTSSGSDNEMDAYSCSSDGATSKDRRHTAFLRRYSNCMSSTRIVVLVVLCLQNSLFTLLRRYSQVQPNKIASKYEILLVGEVIKMMFSAYMIQLGIREEGGSMDWRVRLHHLVHTSKKMVILALIYGSMNILSFVSLRNIGAGMFTIFAQCKILTTAICSTLMLQRQYSWTQWRALISLSLGVLLFSSPIWYKGTTTTTITTAQDSTNAASTLIGVSAVLIEITLSGFASIYFEKVIKKDPQKVTIWERNFQLALASFPVYLCFIIVDSPDGIGEGWSGLAIIVASLGAMGGLLVALSIKYGDSILKTLATTGAIVLSSVLDHLFMDGPLTPVMIIAGFQVVLAICNYTFDTTPPKEGNVGAKSKEQRKDEEIALMPQASERGDKGAKE